MLYVPTLEHWNEEWLGDCHTPLRCVRNDNMLRVYGLSSDAGALERGIWHEI
ncbi:MAG: hypothetical protein WBF05_02190 [Anaerolineales bacterium]